MNILPILRRDANKMHPPRQKAAEAVKLDTIRRLVRRAKEERLTSREAQVLDIFVAAFATMSRVGEVTTLETSNVSADGGTISIRPKQGARTWQRLTKRVSNLHGLRAAERLERRRKEAMKKGRLLLFPGRSGKPLATATVTRHLKKLARRLGVEGRISSHSARKGAAIEAVLAGVPLPVVQALGGWKDINTLQAYIGEGLRRSVPLLDILKRHKEEGRSKKGRIR